MKKVILILFFFNFLLAFDFTKLVDIYRKEGLYKLEKKFDLLLTKEEFWREKLKDYNTSFGWYENPIYILLAKKNNKTLTLYHIENSINKKLKIPIILGKANGDKQKEGDLKTPIGIYKIVTQKRDVSSFYGPFAYVTNYPNPLDRSLNKDGNGIWIHGFPPDTPDKNSTKGCIASPNRYLLELEKNLKDYKKSLLFITKKEIPKASKEDIVKLLSFIFKWRLDWKYNNLNSYLKKYSKDLKSRIGDFKKFKIHKTTVFSRKQKKEILFFDIKITPYPNNLDFKIWRVEMKERYTSPTYKFFGKKLLFIKQNNNNFKIWREF